MFVLEWREYFSVFVFTVHLIIWPSREDDGKFEIFVKLESKFCRVFTKQVKIDSGLLFFLIREVFLLAS